MTNTVDHAVVVEIPTIVTVAAPGPQGRIGPPGPAGSTDGLTLTAGQTLSGHRVVTRQPDGTAIYADNTVAGHVQAPLWLTLAAATVGDSVTVQSSGVVDEPSWSWTPGPLYLGESGALLQTVPVSPALFLTQVGYATSPTSIVLDRQPSIQLI